LRFALLRNGYTIAIPNFSYEQLAATCGVSRPAIARTAKTLQVYNRIRRVGSDKTGHWELIIEESNKE